MAKSTSNDALDALLAEIATSDEQHVTSAEPANHAGIAAVTLGNYAISTGLGGGDFGAAADAGGGGRQTTVAAQSGNNATASGTGTHVAYTDGTTLQHVTTCPSVSTNSGQPLNVGSHVISVGDPT